MFVIHCTTCDRDYLVGTRSIHTFENGPDGPVATARCPQGHVHEVRFRSRPASRVHRPTAA